jgi:hypothetical protein
VWRWVRLDREETIRSLEFYRGYIVACLECEEKVDEIFKSRFREQTLLLIDEAFKDMELEMLK